jgi:hypothetical protein
MVLLWKNIYLFIDGVVTLQKHILKLFSFFDFETSLEELLLIKK